MFELFGSESEEIHELAVEVLADICRQNAAKFTLFEIVQIVKAIKPGAQFGQGALNSLFELRQRVCFR